MMSKEVYASVDPEHCWCSFKDWFLEICDKHAPCGDIKTRGRLPEWANDEFILVCDARDTAMYVWKSIRLSDMWHTIQLQSLYYQIFSHKCIHV